MRGTVHPDLNERWSQTPPGSGGTSIPLSVSPSPLPPSGICQKTYPGSSPPVKPPICSPDLWPSSVSYKWTHTVWSLLRLTSPTQHNLLTWPCVAACVTHCHPGPLPGGVDRGQPARGQLSCCQALAMMNRTPLNIHRTSPQLDQLTHGGTVLFPVLLQVAMLLSFLPLHTKSLLSSIFRYDLSHFPLRLQ